MPVTTRTAKSVVRKMKCDGCKKEFEIEMLYPDSNDKGVDFLCDNCCEIRWYGEDD